MAVLISDITSGSPCWNACTKAVVLSADDDIRPGARALAQLL